MSSLFTDDAKKRIKGDLLSSDVRQWPAQLLGLWLGRGFALWHAEPVRCNFFFSKTRLAWAWISPVRILPLVIKGPWLVGLFSHPSEARVAAGTS